MRQNLVCHFSASGVKVEVIGRPKAPENVSNEVKRKIVERITLKLTFSALVTLIKAEQDCFKELLEAVDITRRISEFIWQ